MLTLTRRPYESIAIDTSDTPYQRLQVLKEIKLGLIRRT